MHECVYLQLCFVECVRRGVHHVSVYHFSHPRVQTHLKKTQVELQKSYFCATLKCIFCFIAFMQRTIQCCIFFAEEL